MDQKPLILIVEDTEEHSVLFIKILNHFGYANALEQTGQGALDFCEKTVPRLILMDIALPDMSGTQVMQHLKAKPHFKTVPIIAISAHPKERIQEENSTELFDDYLSKPFTIEEFIEKIKKHLS